MQQVVFYQFDGFFDIVCLCCCDEGVMFFVGVGGIVCGLVEYGDEGVVVGQFFQDVGQDVVVDDVCQQDVEVVQQGRVYLYVVIFDGLVFLFQVCFQLGVICFGGVGYELVYYGCFQCLVYEEQVVCFFYCGFVDEGFFVGDQVYQFVFGQYYQCCVDFGVVDLVYLC